MASYFNSNMLGLFNTSGSSSNSLFNFNFSDYASIRSGSYKKLLNSYYNQTGNTNQAVSKIVNNTDAKKLTGVKSAADDLSESAKALYTKGKGSAFEDENDRETIDKAIQSFVDDYNDVIDAVDNTDSADVLRKGINLANQTNALSKNLAKVGITVNYDNTLSIDKDAFSKASTSDLKSLFSGVGSFAYQVSTDASQIGLAAKKQSSGTSLYSNTGAYNYYNYNSALDAYL